MIGEALAHIKLISKRRCNTKRIKVNQIHNYEYYDSKVEQQTITIKVDEIRLSCI